MFFAFVVFLSALLLFQVQLMVAKHLLPWFGGTPAVWTTSQMFFQVLLVLGYAYAHLLSGSRPRLQHRVHVALLTTASASLFVTAVLGGVPVLAPESLRPTGAEQPVLLLILALASTVGLPFFALSTTGPLLQRWHSRQTVALDKTYRLYALSNVGSFLGLLSYPLWVERLLTLPQQAWMWAILFVVFAAGCAAIALRMARLPDAPPVEAAPAFAAGDAGAPTRSLRADMSIWVLLSFIGSVTFLSTTNRLTHDVAAVPFLWALPLALYLLTFIISFDRPHWYSRRWGAVAAAASGIAVLPTVTGAIPAPLQVMHYCAFLFAFCMLCHGEVVRHRPPARHLTLFYLLIALGGALGGIFVSIGAPLLFQDYWEFPLVLPLGWLAVAVAWALDRTSPSHTGDRWLFACLVGLVALIAIRAGFELTSLGRVPWVRAYHWPLTVLAVAVCTFAVTTALWRSRVAQAALWPRALILLLAAGFSLSLLQAMSLAREGVVYAARNFYGVVRVLAREADAADIRVLMHGSIMHGAEVRVLGRRTPPTAYYSPSTGIAFASSGVRRSGDGAPDAAGGAKHFGVVGMGVGTMTGFAEPGDRVTYYEINPEVVHIATGPHFTYMDASGVDIRTVLGDARLSLERELREGAAEPFDLLAIDAFSSDAVPVHLLTAEAFDLYEARLRDDEAILAVNVTNTYIDLEPVVAAHARRLGLSAVRVNSDGEPPIPTKSGWILLRRRTGLLDHPGLAGRNASPLGDAEVHFTDQYSNLVSVLK